MSSYDQIPYDSFACTVSHPGHLAAIARILGLRPAAVASCRVLELGCGTGANLLPLAVALPGSRFVGVDLSGAQIAAGCRDVAALGLANLTLVQGDLAALGPELGRFDFVVAHGVFSWIPRPVQEALLRVVRGCLGPAGVALVSYSALPGGYPRQALRDMLGWRTRGEREPLQRVALAREFAALLAEHLSDRAPNAAALRKLIAEMGGMSDAYLLHDLLAEVHEALTLTSFVERAAIHGLQYLGDAQFHAMFPSGLEEGVEARLAEAAGDQLGLEQCLDFLGQRAFRTTLLCRDDARVERQLSWQRIDGLFATTRAQPRGSEDGHWLFRAPGGETFGTSSPQVAEALRILAREHPKPVAVREVCARAGATTEEEIALVATHLLAAFASDQAELTAWDGALLANDGADPLEALCSARLQATRGKTATNLWHETVELSPADRALLPLLDGTRDRAALMAQLAIDSMRLEAGLSALAQSALLVNSSPPP